MIYCFQLCSLPCQACSKACACCGKACSGCTEQFANLLSKPLGGYVIFTWVFMLIALALAGAGFSVACAMTMSAGNCALALIHSLFSMYLFVRLNKAAGDGANGKEVINQICILALHDIGVCLYIFLFIASIGFQFYAITGCAGVSTGAIGMMLFYQLFFVPMYTAFFFCCQAVSGAFGGGSRQGGGGVVMGTPA
eukprot:TRINITY_DN64370_c0_g1_i1.p1 TRINITY_DN64370_c0_g1~~TRINITY_DN64370_c0_g1_i1.p1  ORF type:complete len:195 (-),score=24.99 TRINITY_DN64370_c0_g1_i1:43-627(-)